MFYPLIILSLSSICVILNALLNPMNLPWFVYALVLVCYIILAILIDGIVAFFVRILPNKWFSDYNKKIYNPSKKQIKLYKAIGVNKWKEKVPELGMFVSFRKKQISSPDDPVYLRRYILEACYGVWIHYISFFVSFALIPIVYAIDEYIFTQPSNLHLSIGIPTAFVNAVLIFMPALILRYNLPKLIRLYEAKSKGFF